MDSQKRRNFTITSGLAGQAYFDLLRWCSRTAVTVGFTVSVGRELSSRARTIIRACEERGAQASEVTEWPGTVLQTGRALMYTMPAQTTIEAILAATSDLFSWQEPDLPEDLFFLRDDSSPLLTVIAHEEDAYLSIGTDELESLKHEVPQVLRHLSAAENDDTLG